MLSQKNKLSRRSWRRLAAGVGISCVALVCLAGAGGSFQPVRPLPTGRFIDLHAHTAGIGAGGSGCWISPALGDSYKFGLYLRGFGVTRGELEREGDRIVVDRLAARVAQSGQVGKVVVLALDGAVGAQGNLDRTRTELFVPNEFVAEAVARHDNLLFGASVNPYRPDALARLEWAKAHGAVLVKWLPSIQQIDPMDPRLEPFYRRLVDLQLPLLTHTGSEHSFTRAEDEFCDPARLRRALDCGVTVIAAHAATPGRFHGERGIDRLAAMMREYPRLYADISSLTQVNKPGYLGEVLRRPEFRGRLIYGSDFPLTAVVGLTTPWHYWHRLGVGEMVRIARLANPWDRDVALKQALGVPPDVWVRAEAILALPSEESGRASARTE